MYFSSPILIISLLSTLVSSNPQTSALPTGSDLSGLPKCAAVCSINAFASMTGCQSDDYPCMCRDQNFINKIGVCIQKSCNGEELKQATAYAQGICGPALPTGASATGAAESTDATITISTTTSSGTATTTVAKTSSTTTKGTPNSASGIRPGGFALGAWLMALFAL